jgi:protein TonB
MKTKLIITALLTVALFYAFPSNAQETSKSKETVHQEVDEMPVPPGGMEGWINYFKNNLKYPEAAKKNGIEGMVMLSFIVRSDGSVSDVAVLRGIGGGCDEEAKRLLANSPKWTPGKKENKPVDVEMKLPVQFKL